MNIIDVIFENPLIFAVLVWLFSAVFGGRKKQEEAPRTRPQNANQPEVLEKPIQSVEEKDIESEIQKRYEELKQRNVVQKVEDQPVANPKKEIIHPVSMKKEKHKKKIQLHSPVEGIVWSEILNAPRAKRPFHPIKRNEN